MADYILPVKAVVSPVVGSPTPGVACQPIYQVGADGLVRYRDQDGTVLAFPGGVSHSTVLGTCPATGPTVAPTTEGHYYWTSALGEIWAWEFGAAAPYVTGNPYSALVNYANDPAVTTGGTVRGTFTAHRTGTVIAAVGAFATGNTNINAVVRTWVDKNGLNQFSNTSYANGAVQAMFTNAAAPFPVVAGDVIRFMTYHEQTTTGLAQIRSSIAYT